eukprot:TRINITY_DN33863_c0_g1_i1.p1 TRINITY_DN33863_c0_g1~~TRINITY_DN33863_c0_g1_i1.p1  ORF type:complete len:236 (+),score=38.72 TRINITY_DN33863_c0_g1_i1:44-751(+)
MSQSGKIRRWNPQKGYGFITSAEGSDVFVHRSDIVGDPDEVAEIDVGTLVEYEVQSHEGRLKATSVTAVGGATVSGAGVGGLQVGGRAAGQTKRVVPPGKTVGRVKLWFDSGYGFAVPTSGDHKGKDIYVHHSAFGGGALNIGWELYFEIENDPANGKLRAVKASGPAVCGRGCRAQAPHESFHSGKKISRVPPIAIINDDEDEEAAAADAKPLVVGETSAVGAPIVSDSYKPYN